MAEHVKRWLLLHVLATICLYCLPATVTAQNNAEIVLNVSVVTQEGKFIGELSRDNFAVTVDKLPQNILSFTDREVPASVGILIDDSGSFYDGKKESATLKQHLKEGLERFLKLSHASNEYFVMTFASSPVIVQDWTTEGDLVANSVDAVKFKGQTSLYDAIVNALPIVMSGRNAKHVLLVFTDGADNNSKKGFKEVREALKRSDVLVYFVGPLEKQYDGVMTVFDEVSANLEELALYSGGRVFFAKHVSIPGFFGLFEYLASELRGHYRLLISAADPGAREKWRKLKVSVTKNDSSGRPQKLFVITRPGYYR